MNEQLQKLFTRAYTSIGFDANNPEDACGVEKTAEIRRQLPILFKKHNIKSMFDGGCHKCSWTRFLESSIKYQGGEISLNMVAKVWDECPHLNVILHDITTDPIPMADVLFVRDIAIHLNNSDKLKLLKNWGKSRIPWLLISQDNNVTQNIDLQYSKTNFPIALVNWSLPPWNFPEPIDILYEVPGRLDCKTMYLWHRKQLKGLI